MTQPGIGNEGKQRRRLPVKLTRRRVVRPIAACVMITVAGYSASTTSLSECHADTVQWLPNHAPTGSTATGLHAEPASLFLPFVARVSYEKHFLVAPQEYQDEWGKRYYATFFGTVVSQ